MARRTGDSAALADVIQLCTEAIAWPRTLDMRREWTSEASQIADDLGDPIARRWANSRRMLAALAAGDLATMRDAFSVVESEIERIGQPYHDWVLAYYRTLWCLLDGDLDAAEESANEAFALGTRAGQPDALSYYGAQLSDVRNKQGRLEELIPLIEQRVHDDPGLPAFRASLTRAKSRHDAENEVDALLDVEVANSFQMSEDVQRLTAYVLWAEAAARCGHRHAAAILSELLLPWHAQIVTTHITVSGSVAHYLGLLDHALDRYEEADQWFAEALACHEGMEAPYFVASTQTAWAALLIDRNQPGDAELGRALIDAALPVATERGYGYIERDATELLERLG